MTDNDKMRFAAAMLAMYKAFGKEPDKDITKILFHTLSHLTIDDAEQCITIAMQHEERFPTPAALKKCIAMIPRRDVPRVEHQPKTNQELAQRSCLLINGYMDGKLDRAGLIEGMQVMNKAYPGLGWGAEVSRLISHFNATPEQAGPISFCVDTPRFAN